MNMKAWIINCEFGENMSLYAAKELFYFSNMLCQVACLPKRFECFFYQDKKKKKKKKHSALLQSLIIRSWWAIFSFFHWQRMSSVGIVCRSWCYVRKIQNQFVVCEISPCVPHCAVTYIQGVLKAYEWDCMVTKMKQLRVRCWAGAKTCMHKPSLFHSLLYHFLSFHSHSCIIHSLSLSLAPSFTQTLDVRDLLWSTHKFILAVDSCVWYDLTSQKLAALWKLDEA